MSENLISYLFFKRRLRIIEQQAQQLNELNISKLTALQSQMNPHFIFNALNSIQDYIMMNERKLAGKYLGKFADLMRIYLNYSQQKSISLQEEVEALQLYLELEQLCFGDSLECEITIDQAVPIELISFPSLLIQPYAENALKHGLFHKVGKKELSIVFRKSSKEDCLECEIIDNGIGRKKSGEINQMRNPNHQSFATGATQRRLALLNHDNSKPIGVNTNDLYDSNGNAQGTEVLLNIPFHTS